MAETMLVSVLVPLSLVCLAVVFIKACLCCKRYWQNERKKPLGHSVPDAASDADVSTRTCGIVGDSDYCAHSRTPSINIDGRGNSVFYGCTVGINAPSLSVPTHIEDDAGICKFEHRDPGPGRAGTSLIHRIISDGESSVDPNRPRASHHLIENEIDYRDTGAASTWEGPTTDDTQSTEDYKMDSDLHELMVPNMVESVIREVQSKPIVYISRSIDQMGGTLVLDNMGITLTIPPGAIEPGKPEIIFLALNWDLGDLPRMTPNQTIVSPVVQVGPHGLKLKRQATLSFRHCAFDGNQVKVYSSETHLMQDKEWSATEGGGGSGTGGHRVLDTNCHVYLSHFTLFTCIAEGESVRKWLQIAAFGKMIGGQFEIRVYLLNGTPSALQFAVENEKKFHFKQMKVPQEYIFCDDMTNMILKVESISEGWSSNVVEMQEVIPFLSIWHGKSPFASFVFKRLNRETTEINTTISARQGDESKLQLKLLKEIRQEGECTKGRNEESGDGGLELMASSKGLGFFQGFISEDYVPCSHEDRQMTSPVLPWRDTSSFHLSSQARRALTSPRNPTHVIPHKLKMKLVDLMDPLKAAGNDWRMIASELGFDSKIDFLGMQKSPFLEVLGIMQGMKKDLRWLKETLILHERIDAADVITQYLETTGSD